MTAKRPTQTITYVCSRDCGCEITDAELDDYIELVRVALVEAYPDADVEVELTRLSASSARADDADLRDVMRIAQDVWEAGEFWQPTEETR